jgi:predicted PurR-regulated permease PerM
VATSPVEERPASRDEEAAATAPAGGKVEIVVSVATVVKALAILFGLVLVVIARDAILSIVLSAVMVLGLDPPVSALERRGWGRGKAALAVFAAIAVSLFVIVVWAVGPVWNEIKELVAQLPSYVDELRDSPVLKQLDENTDAFAKLQATLVDAAKQIPAGAAQLLGAAGSAIGSVFSLVTLVFLTLFGLIAKPTLTRSALALMHPQTAARVGATLDEVTHTISFSLVGNVVISVIAATVVGVSAVIVGAPFPVVLALIVGLFDLIPQVGSAIAAFIVVLITLIASGLVPAVILLVVILVYQQVENYLIQPAVMRQAVELSGFATIACVMLGGALLGVVGAILAVPVAASVKVIVKRATEGRRARMAALRGEGAEPGLDAARATAAT